jgi:uncharacterized protein (TIGR00290 family)
MKLTLRQKAISMTKEKILFAWSSGKDSARALYEIRRQGTYEIAALLTTMTEDYDRVSMHGVRRALVEKQAERMGYPLEIVWIPRASSNEIYEDRMQAKLVEMQSQGIMTVAFGDIFLEDLRKYREDNLAKQKMNAIFPLWKMDTRALAQSLVDIGFKAIVTCVDTQVLDASFAGREIDKQFLADLPPPVDPCGENGEFHSFVYGGPIFAKPLSCATGEKVLRDGRFCFCDVVECA